MSYFHTPPLDIIDHPADGSHASGLLVWPPRYIIIHATAGTNSLDWLSTTRGSGVSVHRLIDKAGQIYKILPDEKQCWGAGFASVGSTVNLNPYALQLELENLNDGKDLYPFPQVLSCAKQVAEWYGLYGALPILSHAQTDRRKSDPVGFPWRQFYGELFALIAAYVAEGQTA